MGIYNALREADCDFDAIDNQGDTPLHLAAELGASHFATSLLYGGVYCSGGDIVFNVALWVLMLLCVYADVCSDGMI